MDKKQTIVACIVILIFTGLFMYLITIDKHDIDHNRYFIVSYQSKNEIGQFKVITHNNKYLNMQDVLAKADRDNASIINVQELNGNDFKTYVEEIE